MRNCVLVGLLLLSGIANAGPFDHKVSPQDLDGIQRMAVQVRLGDTFHASFVGTTVFNNKFFDAPVPQWGIDSFIAQYIVEDMKLRGRFPAQALDVGDLNMQDLYKKSGAILGSREVVATLLEKAKQQGADALMVVEMVRPSQNFQFHQPGFGLFRKSTFGLTMGCIYSVFNTVVFRVDTAKRIAWGGDEPCLSSREKGFEQKDSWDQYTAEEKAAFEAAVKQQLSGKIALRLEQYKLLKDTTP